MLQLLNSDVALISEWKALATAAERGQFVEDLKWVIAANKQDDALFQITFKDWKYGINKKSWEEFLSGFMEKYPYDYSTMIKNYVKSSVNGISISESYTIFSYTTFFYYEKLNGFLRNGVNSVLNLKIRDLLNHSLLKMPRVPANTLYYRGIPLEGNDLANFLTRHKEGNIVVYDEFLSCANNRKDAFIDLAKSNIKITIETKVNSKAHNIWELSWGKIQYGTTDEALFRTQSKFKVLEVEPQGNNIFKIKLQEIE